MKKTKKMLSIIMTAVLLFVAYSAATPPLGPGLSHVAALNATTASPTDLSLMPIEPEENSVTADITNPNATPTQNAVLQVVVNQPNIHHATIEIIFDEYVYLYGFKNVGITAQRANTMVGVTYLGDDGKITVTINNSDAVTQGQKLLQFYFYGAITSINPCTRITYSATAYTANNTAIANAFTYQLALLGNPEYYPADGESIINGSIDSEDALWILQYVAGKHTVSCCPDIALRKLAADVDLDGSVSASDSQLVLKRPVGKIQSFLDINRIYPPYGATIGEVLYQMRSTQTNRYLQRTSNDTLCLWDADTSTDGLFRFEKTGGNECIYRIISVTYEQELCLDQNNNLVLTDSGANIKPNSNRWYVIPSGSKYIIMNTQTGDRTLGDLGRTSLLSNCGVSYLDYGNVWEVVPYVNLKLYYDGAYASRHQNSNASQVSQELAGYRNEIAAILEANFNIDVKTSFTPVSHTSLLDTMTASHSKETYCACSGTNNEICKQYRSASSAPGTGVHHNNYVYQLYHFRNAKANSLDYHLLYSGYKNCGGYMNENNVLAHTTNAVAGVANTSGYQVSMVFYTGDDVFYHKKYAALHEVCHTLGAIVDKEELTPDTEHGNCVMSYDRNVELMEDYWLTSKYKSLLCKNCRYLINIYFGA